MKVFRAILIIFIFLLVARVSASAVSDPIIDVTNNKVGVHILSPSEVGEAARLVNSQGGDWGYVTVPIQPTDRDLKTWNDFMTACQNLHLIPIIRITTLPEGGTWADPDPTDLVDFANFLNALHWPTANRYIVLFNEVNRQEEWGGKVDPAAYARIIHNAAIIFKARSPDFFLLGGALDSAVPSSSTSLSAPIYLSKMLEADSEVFDSLDGFASHSYPNPAFRAPVTKTGWQSITSYKNETAAINLVNKPVFITETGWDTSLSPTTLRTNWQKAFAIWDKDPHVIAVTPFILQGGDAYRTLSLLTSGGEPTVSYQTILELPKTQGSPNLSPPTSSPAPNSDTLYGSNASASVANHSSILLSFENFLRRLFGLMPRGSLSLRGQTLTVELADNSASWEQGLSGRASLQEGEGMLFIFPTSHIPTFWMKDMQFGLDLIWINDQRIVDITRAVPVPGSGPLPIYSPAHKSNWVLEVPSGYADKYGLSVGDVVTREY